ncbi:YjcZ family sporulation protein [Ectobacillus polymachus]|uniref:YjcZ family sporulation protein n=1 Tax=Ectobacillus polymachus TaxID=1508806 RepID=UPI003A85E849
MGSEHIEDHRHDRHFHGGGFALVVVLFILLIIIGCSWGCGGWGGYGGFGGYGYGYGGF